MSSDRNDFSNATNNGDCTDPFGNGVRIGEAKHPGPAQLRVGSWNVWGIADSKDGEINAKRKELQLFLDDSAKIGRRFDMFFVQETWLLGDDELEIEGYTWFGRNRTKIDPDAPRDSGGSGVLVHESIKHRASVLKKPVYGGTEGVIWLKMEHGNSRRYDVFCSLYLEQQRQRFATDNEVIFDGIKSDWEKYTQGAYNAFVIGDFNTRVGRMQESRSLGPRGGETHRPDAQGRNLIERLSTMHAGIVHGRRCDWRYTYQPDDNRAKKGHKSVIDYMVMRDDRFGHIHECGIDLVADVGSDHNLLWLTLDYDYERATVTRQGQGKFETRYRTARLRVPAEEAKFCDAVRRELQRWQSSMARASSPNIETAWAEWREAMKAAAMSSIGSRRLRQRAQPRDFEPWWKPELTALKRKRQQLRGKLRHCFDESSARFARLLVEHANARKAMKAACRKARREWRDEKLEKIEAMLKVDPKHAWEATNEMAGKKKNVTIGAIRNDQGNMTFKTDEKLRIFAEKYAELGRDEVPNNATYDLRVREEMTREVEQLRRRTVTNQTGPLNGAITADEIRKQISKQKDRACSPLDQITNSMLMAGGEAVIESLVLLFNLIFESGESPEQWQQGVMTLLPKSGDLTDWANYRGITLLSIVGKVFEGLMANRIFEYLEVRGGLPVEQGGFRRGFGCSDHVFVLAETIKHRARRNVSTHCAFLDIRKAYPTMNRAAMLTALDKAGIDGRMWRIVDRMYASTRTRITLDGELSQEYTVESGLREGSVLSPILYSVFINSAVEELESKCGNCGVQLQPGLKVRVLLYADDVALIADSKEQLQRMLTVMEEHANRLQYQFSVPKRNAKNEVTSSGKSQVVVFGENGISPDSFFLHGVELEQKRSYKYLGVQMHQRLGKHRGTADVCPQDYTGKLFLDDDHNELRCIEGVRYEPSTQSWMAGTVLCDEEGVAERNTERREYHLNNENSGIDYMIRRASTEFELAGNKPPADVGAWDLHVQSKIGALNKQQWLLRRMQCKLGGFSPAIARSLMIAITEGSTNYAAEIWNTARTQWGALESTAAQLHRRILGCQSKTSTRAMRAELAVTSQQGQRDKASLRFLYRILRMEPRRLTKRVFECVQRDPLCERGAKENWATVTIPAILKKYKLPALVMVNSMSKGQWKKRCREAIEAHECEQLQHAKGCESKLEEYAELHTTSNGLPRYLKQRRTASMCHGRSVKTKLRCGTSELEIETGRHERPVVPRSRRLCRCCAMAEIEDSYHFVMRCPRFRPERRQMMTEIENAIGVHDHHKWRRMNLREKWRFLLGDGPPVHEESNVNLQWGAIETSLYHFLSVAYRARRAFVKTSE